LGTEQGILKHLAALYQEMRKIKWKTMVTNGNIWEAYWEARKPMKTCGAAQQSPPEGRQDQKSSAAAHHGGSIPNHKVWQLSSAQTLLTFTYRYSSVVNGVLLCKIILVTSVVTVAEPPMNK